METNSWYNIIVRLLSPRVSPMVYLMTTVSAFAGYCVLTGFLIPKVPGGLYFTLIEHHIWGAALVLGGLSCLYGYAKDKDWPVQTGALLSFVPWLFASISLGQVHAWYAMIILPAFQASFFAYVNLATALGVLKRAPEREILKELRAITKPDVTD